MVIRLLTVSTAHALPARIGLESIGLVGDQLALLVSPLVALVHTTHEWTSPRGWKRRRRGFWRRCCSTVGQNGEAVITITYDRH